MDVFQWGPEQLNAIRDSRFPSITSAFFAHPDLFSEGLQKAYFDAIEGFTSAMTGNDSVQKAKGFRDKYPNLDTYLKSKTRGVEDLFLSLRKNSSFMSFLSSVKNKSVTHKEFQYIIEALLMSSLGEDLLLLMTDGEISFCELLRRVDPGFQVKKDDAITIKGFPDIQGSDTGPIIDAEWLIDRILHGVVYYIVVISDADSSSPSIPTANTLH